MDEINTSVPTVHMNGTSKNELISQLETAVSAIRVAVTALENAAPNGRDYYPQGDGAIGVAMQRHQDQCQRFGGVVDELNDTWGAILDQWDNRPSGPDDPL